MFACFAYVSAEEPAALVALARDFSPRYEVVRDDLVIVDVSGLSRLLGTPQDIADACHRLARERGLRIGIAVAATQTAAMVLGLAQAGAGGGDRPVVVRPGQEATAMGPLSLDWLAALPVTGSAADAAYLRRRASPSTPPKPTKLTQSKQTPPKDTAVRRSKHSRFAGWHYRLAPPPLPAETPSSVSKTVSSTQSAIDAVERRDPPEQRGRSIGGNAWGELRAAQFRTEVSADVPGVLTTLSAREREAIETRAGLLETLARWGLRTIADFARLPVVQVFERLGDAGVRLHEIACGRDARPLVHTPPEEPFEASFALEWPIDTLEPLSFVVTRLLESLCARLERADRAAAVLDTILQLVTREQHTCRLELPAAMRDPKVLRTLVLLDLESHPPTAGIDRVTIVVTPTPGRIVQHSLLVRALPPPEQLSTLTARLTAVMGEGRVGAPALVDTHRPEAFAMERFAPDERGFEPVAAPIRDDAPHRTLRRFRQPVFAHVIVEDGRPVHVTPQGLPGGPVTQAAGPWRTSGDWWKPREASWDRDEWDVSLRNGCVYHLHHERAHAHWFVAGCYD
jgi:protein ImuB